MNGSALQNRLRRGPKPIAPPPRKIDGFRKRDCRELRATLALAKLVHAAGKEEAARPLLAQALEGLPEGSELSEVAEASRLLAPLAGTGATHASNDVTVTRPSAGVNNQQFNQ